MDKNIIAAFVGVCVGWVLSQITDFFKQRSRKKRKIQSIYTELSDVQLWIDRMLEGTKYSIQLIALNQRIESVPSRLHVFIFEEYFHEICVYLPRDSRIGLTDYYDSVKAINESIDKLKKIVSVPDQGSHIEQLSMVVEAIHSTAFNMRFTINFLLKNKGGDMNKLKGVGEKLDKDCALNIDKIVEEARCIGLEGIKSNYYKKG